MKESEIKEQELLQKGWIKAWVIFEVQAVSKDVVEEALKVHLGKIKSEKALKVLEENAIEAKEVDAPEQLHPQGIKKLWSGLHEMIIFTKDVEALMNMVINYGPSAIEILAPEKITLKMGELQGALASVSDMMHKYAAAGVGGMLISGK